MKVDYGKLPQHQHFHIFLWREKDRKEDRQMGGQIDRQTLKGLRKILPNTMSRVTPKHVFPAVDLIIFVVCLSCLTLNATSCS